MQLGPFVSRDDFIAYLDEYASWLGNQPGVKLRRGVNVKTIERHNIQWQLDTSAGQLTAAQVVIATGPDHQPFIPSWPGRKDFDGEIRHAAHFGEIAQYRGKRVLIVGGGNSGVDIANHLLQAGHCSELWISMRHGSHLLPSRFLGMPLQLTAPLLGLLPLGWQVPTPVTGALTRLRREGVAPAFDDGFIAGLKTGRIRLLPELDRFEADGVVFKGGERLRPDTVLCVTGYRSGLEQLVGHLGILDPDGTPAVDAPEPALPSLWLFGMRPRIEGNLLARRREARQLAKRIADQRIRQPLPHADASMG